MGFAADPIGSKAKERLLRFLIANASYSYSLSGLARRAGVPKASASRALNDWAGSGIVSVTRIGNTNAIRLEEGFPLLAELKALLTR